MILSDGKGLLFVVWDNVAQCGFKAALIDIFLQLGTVEQVSSHSKVGHVDTSAKICSALAFLPSTVPVFDLLLAPFWSPPSVEKSGVHQRLGWWEQWGWTTDAGCKIKTTSWKMLKGSTGLMGTRVTPFMLDIIARSVVIVKIWSLV